MFDYIYGNKSRHFNFIRLPQVLFTDELFRPLSSDTKILYALLLDRTTLSIKKHWLDSEGRVYINFPISEISAKIGVGTQKAVKLMRELENFGLIERVRIGLGKPDRIYVKHCGRSADNADEPTNETAMKIRNNDDVGSVESVETVGADVSISPFKNCENHNSAVVKTTTPEFPESQFPLYNQTEIAILNQSNLINPDSRRNDRNDYAAQREVYEQIIKENIEYDWFVSVFELPLTDRWRPSGSLEELDNIVSIMLDCVCSNAEKIRVNGSEQYTSVVRSQFLKLNNEHIQYVLKCLNECDSTVVNIRAYLITVLYNAPMTMDTAFGLDFRSTFGKPKGGTGYAP